MTEDADYKFGIEGEIIFQKYMKKEHKIKIYKLETYHFSDFIDYDRQILYEVKRRRCIRLKKPVLFIQESKIERLKYFNEAKTYKYTLIFICVFEDGMFYHIYNDFIPYRVVNLKSKKDKITRKCITLNTKYLTPINKLYDKIKNY